MSIKNRGFGGMDKAKQREIASKGGVAAHRNGTAHEWTPDEARKAGEKGGTASGKRARQARRNDRLLPPPPINPPTA